MKLVVVLLAASFLAACGGSSGGGEAPNVDVAKLKGAWLQSSVAFGNFRKSVDADGLTETTIKYSDGREETKRSGSIYVFEDKTLTMITLTDRPKKNSQYTVPYRIDGRYIIIKYGNADQPETEKNTSKYTVKVEGEDMVLIPSKFEQGQISYKKLNEQTVSAKVKEFTFNEKAEVAVAIKGPANEQAEDKFTVESENNTGSVKCYDSYNNQLSVNIDSRNQSGELSGSLSFVIENGKSYTQSEGNKSFEVKSTTEKSIYVSGKGPLVEAVVYGVNASSTASCKHNMTVHAGEIVGEVTCTGLNATDKKDYNKKWDGSVKAKYRCAIN